MDKRLYPLTGPQMNIWQLEKVNESSKNLNTIYSVLKLPQKTDLKLLDKTLNKIREINDSLRLRFIVDENCEIQQYVEDFKYVPSRIIMHDSEEILSVIENEKSDLLSVDGKVNELAIIKTPFNCFVLYKSHHILSDGWGMTQVADQIKEIYCALENGTSLENYKKPSYLDFVAKEQEYLKSTRFVKDSAYWKDLVKKIEPCTFFKNINNFDKSAKRFEHEIPADICEKIENYCTENKLTEYAFFIGIISIYFYNIYNINNFAIGTPFLNRQKRFGEFEETGLHVATLPLHICIDEMSNFVEFCKDINSKNLSLYKHGSFPYYNIQKLFDEEKGINSNLYEIGFSYQINVSGKEFNSKCYDKTINEPWNKGIGECAWLFSGEQNNSITFHLTQLNIRKLFAIDYLTSVFSDSEIDRINETIFYLIDQVLNYSETQNNVEIINHGSAEKAENAIKISNFDMLSANQKQLLKKFNNTGNIPEIDKNVIDYLEEVVQKHPKKNALICDNLKMSYEDFYDKINTLSDLLIDNGVCPNSPIVLLFDKSFDMIIAMFATLKIGCYYVPILPDENSDRIKYIIEDCNPKIILTHKNYDDILKNYNIEHINLSNIFSPAYLDNFDELEDSNDVKVFSSKNLNISIKNKNIKPSSIAYTIYTSGSTGNPKGVKVMHKNIVSLIESTKHDSVLKPLFSDVSMSLLKYSFDASGIDIYSSLLIRWHTCAC